jgi:acyl carrier protein
MTAREEILARVTTVIVQSLGVDEDDVTPAATLVGDLGAESIDFLDIVFRLERAFGIKIPRGELFIEPTSLSEPGYERDGRVTAEGLAALRTQMPYADLGGLERDGRLDQVADLFTVDLLVRYVTWKLEGGRIRAEGPGTAVLTSPPTNRPAPATCLPEMRQ